MRFHDRADAGRQLARRLSHLHDEHPVVLALPRGGVPVAAEIATALGAPLDLLLVRKIGSPGQPELAAGAVVGGPQPEILRNEEIIRQLRIPDDHIEQEAARQLAEIERRRMVYGRGRPPVPIRGRTVILVDDGIATGATMRAALRALAAGGEARRVVLAIPVAPPELAGPLGTLCDEAVFLHTPADFMAVGRFYEDFRQTEDSEVIALLDGAALRGHGSGDRPANRPHPSGP
ncbi:putative phosphoribosyl transferase [Roseomonas rosea]|uniref:Putative phosphoribosyl transferase n=1 Tax=Muricoccus roseus TaxID=198092 RepID=A0A1M6GTY8_9PROT|nr:phosphoribosyltransferase [Roseomonas rosea]SHJ13405.1 putative phosphoribosyl transferase [Roseomonas rosea]